MKVVRSSKANSLPEGEVLALVQLKLKPAKREYFKWGHSVQWGTIYFIKRPRDSEFEGPYLLRPEHIENETFNQYLRDGVVWVKA